MLKKEVLIVGSFITAKNGATGGIAFACKGLMESELSKEIKWIKIDSTAKIPIESVTVRGLRALTRIISVTYYLLVKRKITSLFLFVSDGSSFIEKGFIVFIGKLFGKKIVLAPVSGYLPAQLDRKWFKKYVIAVLKKSDYVICQSKEWQRYFSGLCPHRLDRYVVVNNWIDISRYEKLISERTSSTNIYRVLFLGWITKEKGIFDLIEAIWVVKKSIPNIEVYVAGNGKDMIEASELVRTKGLEKILFLKGWISNDEKMRLLKESDVFILPSHAEGFPYSVLEAMASGLPVILTNFQSANEVVDKESGVVVEIGNVEQISDAIKHFGNPEVRLKAGRAALERVKSHFTIDRAVESYRKILL